MRLIDAEELTKSIEKAKEITKVACERMEPNTIGRPDIVLRCSTIMLEKTLEVINLCETVESRSKGKWIVNKRKGGYLQDMTCSNCGKTLSCDDDLTREYKFCMGCGADMREE